MEYKKVVAWMIVIFMALSMFGYVGSSFFSEDTNKKEYNGFTFYKSTSGGWIVKTGGKDYLFTYLPTELENITFDGSTKDVLFSNRIYLIYEPEDNLNSDQAMNKMGTFFFTNNKAVNKACATAESCPDIPIKDCTDSPGVLFQKDNKSSLETKGKCLVLKGSDEFELNKVSERAIYSLLGII